MKRLLCNTGIVFLCCCLLFSFPLSVRAESEAPVEVASLTTVRAVEDEISKLVSERTIGFYYQSLKTGEVYAYNEQARFKSASTTKLPVVLCAYQLAADGQLNLNDTMTYTAEVYYHGGSGIIQYMDDGGVFTIRKLVQYAVHYSDNVAYDMLRDKLGGRLFTYINKLGARFDNNFNSEEIAVYLRAVYDFAENNGALGEEFLSFFVNTAYENRIPAAMPDVTVAHKIGNLTNDAIYHDAAVVYDSNPYLLVIMTLGVENNNASFFVQLAQLINRRNELLYNNKPVEPGTLVVGGLPCDVDGAYIEQDGNRLMLPLGRLMHTQGVICDWYPYAGFLSFFYNNQWFTLYPSENRINIDGIYYECVVTVSDGTIFLSAEIVRDHIGLTVYVTDTIK